MNPLVREQSGAGGTLGSVAHAGPAQPGYQVGSVGFGPAWNAEDSMAASIVRLEHENEELRAEVALLREERAILERQFGLVAEWLTVRGVSLNELREDFLSKWRRDK